MNLAISALPTPPLSDQNVPIPIGFWKFTVLLKRVHTLWKGSLYLENLSGFLAGVSYKTLTGGNPFFTWPTIPFFVIARFLDLFEQEDAWNLSRIQLLYAVKRIYPVHLHIKPSDPHSACLGSKYPFVWFKTKAHSLWIRTQRIALASFNFGWQTFKLTMRIMDVVELATLDWSTVPNRSAIESGIHVPRCLSFFSDAEKKKIFFDRLKHKKEGLFAMQELLMKHPALNVEEQFNNLFEYLELGLTCYEKTIGLCGNTLVFLLKQTLYDWSPKCVKEILQTYEEKNNKPLKRRPIKPLPRDITFYNPVPVNQKKISPLKMTPQTPSKISSENKTNRSPYALQGKQKARFVNPNLIFTGEIPIS